MDAIPVAQPVWVWKVLVGTAQDIEQKLGALATTHSFKLKETVVSNDTITMVLVAKERELK